MKKITNIKERVLQIAEYYKLSKETFFTEIGSTYANFKGVKKQSGLNSDTIEKIVTMYPDINLMWLVTGTGDMMSGQSEINAIQVKEPYQNPISAIPQTVTISPEGKDNVVLVPVRAAAGYLNGYGDPEFIQNLPAYNLPSLRNGVFRMFEVNGDSMYPTIQNKSLVVGQWIENWVKDVKDDRVYVVVSREKGVIVKRLLNRIKKYGNIYCKSDNRKEYPSFPLNPSDIMEIWEVKMHLSFELPNPAELYDRMNDLEADMEFLKQFIKQNKSSN